VETVGGILMIAWFVMVKDRGIAQKRKRCFDRGMLSDAIVFFAFTLFAYSRIYSVAKRTVFFDKELFIIPQWSYLLYGTLTLIMAIVFLIAVFNNRLADMMKSFIEKPCGFIYWTYFLGVYTIAWLEAVLLIDPNECTFHLVVYIGVVIFIIIFVMFVKSIVRFIKWLIKFSVVSR